MNTSSMNLMLDAIGKDTLLCFADFEFRDPIEYLKKYNRIFPGSFNPVHDAHLAVGEQCLFEICVDNFYKGMASPADIWHRIHMLSYCGVPVLLTRARTYTEKDTLFKSKYNKDYIYRIGSDAWNRCVASEGMFDGVTALFEVCAYPGETVSKADLNFAVLTIPRPQVRASDIRLGKYHDMPDVVVKYITEHRLYLP